jgi:branched-chain amino acid transport system substrate-binding protein
MRTNGMWLLAASLAAAGALAACGGDDDDAKEGNGGGTLTIYSSLPLQGDSRPQSQDMVRGIRMALQKAGGRAGRFTIRYVSLDDATAAAGKWDPGATSSNARKALADDKAIGYIGEFNSGATAISLPLLNEGGMLQIAPSNTAVGLTRSEGADEGEPERYYPTGTRTYGRVVPADHIQAAAQVGYMKQKGCRSVYLLHDKEVYGTGLTVQVGRHSSKQGVRVLGSEGIDTRAANFRSLAAKIKASEADCFFFGGITQNKAVQVFKDVDAANPRLLMFGPSGVAEEAFTTKLGAGLEKRTFIISPTLDPSVYPPSAQDFYRDFKARHDKLPEPYAIYGYESMAVMLDAIERAGDQGNDRRAVVQAFFQTKDRDSVLGTYSIDKNGDTTLAKTAGYKISKGGLVFDGVIEARL